MRNQQQQQKPFQDIDFNFDWNIRLGMKQNINLLPALKGKPRPSLEFLCCG